MRPDPDTATTAAAGLTQLERLALSMAKAQLRRGENPPVNTTATLLLALERMDAARPVIEAEARKAGLEEGFTRGRDYERRQRQQVEADARAAERRRWAARLREIAAVALPEINLGTREGVEALNSLAQAEPNSPAQIQGRLLLDLADTIEGATDGR